MLIEQAVYGAHGAGGYHFLARSPGFRDEWLPEAERLCTGFGERPAGVACPQALFARPFGPRHVAVVQVADQGRDDAGRPGALGFHLAVLPQQLYHDLGGDPFWVAEHLAPPWEARGELPARGWTAGPPPYRTVEAIQKVLDVPHSATLLGGVQALLDGGRLAFERNEPAPGLVRGLWALLPTSTRRELWPATFAFTNAHQFDVVVVPRASGPEYARYLAEVQAGDYPEGRYELNLQIAVEAGDQRAMDALFGRRSRSQTLRLALLLLAVFALGPIAVNLLAPGPAPPERPAEKPAPGAKQPAPADKMELPPADEFRTLNADERAELAARLGGLGRRLKLKLSEEDSPKQLGEALAGLSAGADARLGPKAPQRDPGRLAALGPPERQLRALLWKYGAPDYNARGLNVGELADRLEEALAKAGAFAEGGRE